MTLSRPFQNAFSAGEIDPLLHARSDFQRYQTGLAACRGFLPLRQGGVTRAPGTIWRGTTRANAVARRVPFEFSAEDALELEFTDLTMRVWRYGALVESGGSPYELTTPFPEATLGRLQWVQDKDVIYLTDGARAIQKLSRLALDSWTIEDAVFDSGPFRLSNDDEDVTIEASGESGSITLSGVGSPFSADMVGQLMLLEPSDGTNLRIWTPDHTASKGDYVVYDGRVYKCDEGGNSGTVPPTHLEGRLRYEVDENGLAWIYKSDLKGVVRITGYTNPNSVTATVLRTIPKHIVGNPTHKWSEGAWNDRWGWPATLQMMDQRLWGASTPADPRTVWASAIGAFEDFLPSIEDDGAFGFTIDASQTQNQIRWLFRDRHGIFIGAIGEVLLGFSNATDLPIGPKTFDTERVASGGVSRALPISAYGYPIYVDKGGTRVQEIRATLNEEKGEPAELSLPSQHLGAAGFEQIVWQAVPQRLAWLRTGVGGLVVMSYDPAQDVLGWAPVPIAGGVVEDMAVSPSADGRRDVLTLVVRRDLDGGTVRCVEELADINAVLTGAAGIETAVHFYCAAEFAPEPATDTFSVPHLAGEEVWAWTDHGEHGPLTVAGDGTVTLPVAVGTAVIGLLDTTHYVETLDLEAQARDGSSRGRLRRLESPVGIDLHATAAGRVRAVERNFGKPDRLRGAVDLLPLAVAQDLTTAWSGTARLGALVSGQAGAVRLRFEPYGGAPLTITGISPSVEEAGP